MLWPTRMSSSSGKAAPFFNIQGHRIPAQHIREYEHGIGDESKTYYLDINQYTPLSFDSNDSRDAYTIIAATGIGMIKVCSTCPLDFKP